MPGLKQPIEAGLFILTKDTKKLIYAGLKTHGDSPLTIHISVPDLYHYTSISHDGFFGLSLRSKIES